MLKTFLIPAIAFTILLFSGILVPVHTLTGQSVVFEPEKAGQLILANQLQPCTGADIQDLGVRMTNIVGWLKQNNPVLGSPRGFEAFVYLSGNPYKWKASAERYGIPAILGISFRYFYNENGQPKTAIDWAAYETEMIINDPLTNFGQPFGGESLQADDPPQFKSALEQAHNHLKKYRAIPGILQRIAPGVTLYEGNKVFISNPERLDFWKPVTVKEIMEAKLSWARIQQDCNHARMAADVAAMAEMGIAVTMPFGQGMYDIMLAEYQNFSPSELAQNACFSSDESLSGINARGIGWSVVKPNPEAWDRTLPVTAIQFISFSWSPPTMNELEEFRLNNNGLTDFVGLYMRSLPVEKMRGLIN